jgi:hypothetical protein
MTLAETIKAMTDEELEKLTSNTTSYLHLSPEGLGAQIELMRRAEERRKSIKSEQAMAKHEKFLRQIEIEGFQKPTVKKISSILNSATHLALSNGIPELFEVFEGWENSAEHGFILRIRNSFYDTFIRESIHLREDIIDLGCIYKRQVYEGMIRGNQIIIRGQNNDDSDLFIDTISFLRKEFVPVL